MPAHAGRECGLSAGILQHLAKFIVHQIFREQIALLKGSEYGFAQSFHGLRRVEFGHSVVLRFEPTLQEKITEALHQFVEVDLVGKLASIFAVFGDFHFCGLYPEVAA